MKFTMKLTAIAMASMMANAAYAGSFILAGTDADDHGSATSTQNVDGWLFMQKAIENIATSVTNGAKIVYSLGSDIGSTAYSAAYSAFSKSTLVASGWTFQNVNGAANIATFLQSGAAGAGIIMLDSGSQNVGGGLSSTEESALTTNASFINTFVGSGGGLFSQANSYGWLSALVPTLSVTSYGGGGLSGGLALTGAGNTAFPGLSNSDLSSGPYHASFNNVGALPVLAKGTGGYANLDVILGAAGGSIIVPTNPVPEPETYALMLAGLGIMGMVARRRKAAK